MCAGATHNNCEMDEASACSVDDLMLLAEAASEHPAEAGEGAESCVPATGLGL